MSSTFQSDRQTLRAPDIRRAWVKPTKPSPPASRPSAVSHADNVTISAFRSQPRWISRTESRPSKAGFWCKTCSSGSGKPVWFRITAERAGVSLSITPCVARWMKPNRPSSPDPARLSSSRARLHRSGGGIRSGADRPGLEEPGERPQPRNACQARARSLHHHLVPPPVPCSSLDSRRSLLVPAAGR